MAPSSSQVTKEKTRTESSLVTLLGSHTLGATDVGFEPGCLAPGSVLNQ